MSPVHLPAMVSEVVEYLQPAEGMTFLDMTLGMAGHTRQLVQHGAFVIGLDRDAESLSRAAAVLDDLKQRVLLIHGRMSQAEELLEERGIGAVDGCLIDAGISMDVLRDPVRGFSVDSEQSLDMRMDRSDPTSLTASRVVNEYLEKDLARIFAGIGRGREAHKVAARIVRARERSAIQSTAQLADIIAAAVAGVRPVRRIDAAPYLMAIRSAVNEELPELEAGIEAALRLLSSRSRLVILSWNGAEHRVSRQLLRRLANPCQCPPALPCTCDKKPVIKVLTPKPLYPTAEEVSANPAARSVRLHAAEKL